MNGEEEKFQYHTRSLKDHLNPGRTNPRYRTRSYLREEIKRILDTEEFQRGGTVVDYGCGDKPYAPLFKDYCDRYLGADLPGNADADITLSREGKIETEAETADCVLSVQVLEHVAEPERYLAEAWRVLKRDGSLILSTHGMWPYHADPVDYRRWTKEGLVLELEKTRFEVISMKGILSKPSIALQLWQDATMGIWPGYVRNVYCGFFQVCIGMVEKWRGDKPSDDACIFVVHAKKTVK